MSPRLKWFVWIEIINQNLQHAKTSVVHHHHRPETAETSEIEAPVVRETGPGTSTETETETGAGTIEEKTETTIRSGRM